jgi:hypothetical protein
MKEPVTGMPWIRSKDYDYLLGIFEDSATFPRTWRDWIDVAEAKLKYFESSGKRILKVPIEPHEFVRWCAANGHTTGATGRRAFVTAKLSQKHGQSDLS